MPNYYIAEDGTIRSREAEHRTHAQHTVPAPPQAEDAPQVSTARKCVYWLFTLFFGVMIALYVYDAACAEFTPPAHLDFLEDYVQQFIFEHAKALVLTLSVLGIYLYGKHCAAKRAYNVLTCITTSAILWVVPFAAVLLLIAAPMLAALVLAVLVLAVVGLVKMIFS